MLEGYVRHPRDRRPFNVWPGMVEFGDHPSWLGDSKAKQPRQPYRPLSYVTNPVRREVMCQKMDDGRLPEPLNGSALLSWPANQRWRGSICSGVRHSGTAPEMGSEFESQKTHRSGNWNRVKMDNSFPASIPRALGCRVTCHEAQRLPHGFPGTSRIQLALPGGKPNRGCCATDLGRSKLRCAVSVLTRR